MNVLDRLPQLWGEPANFGEMRSSALVALGDRVTVLESIDFAGKKGAKVTQKKTCVKGDSCGFTCIKKGLQCNSEMKAKEKEFAGYMKKSAGTTKAKAKAASVDKAPVAAKKVKKDDIPDVKKETIAAKVDKKKPGDPMHNPDSHISESISGGYRVIPPEASDLIKRYKGISVIDKDDAEMLTSLRGNGDTKKDVEGIAKQLSDSIRHLDSPPPSTGLSSEQSKLRDGKKIKSQADFDKEVDRFVKVADPGDFEIYKLRRSLGDRMTRAEFDSMLMKAQSNGLLQLYGGSLKSRNDLALLDSVATETSGLRTYFRRGS
jgi:hypothetical protein